MNYKVKAALMSPVFIKVWLTIIVIMLIGTTANACSQDILSSGGPITRGRTTGVEGPWDVSSGDKRSPRLNVTITALEEDNETSPGGKTLK